MQSFSNMIEKMFSAYMKSIEYMNGIHENYYLGGDMLGNIFTCKYQNDIINDDDDRNHLEICGEYHCDDIINCMIQGTLIGQPIDNHHHQHHHSSSSSNNENNSTQQQQQQHHINDYQRQSGMSIFHSNYLSITGLPLDTTSPSSSSSSILLGGINGSISTILSLDEDSYTFFFIIEIPNSIVSIWPPDSTQASTPFGIILLISLEVF